MDLLVARHSSPSHSTRSLRDDGGGHSPSGSCRDPAGQRMGLLCPNHQATSRQGKVCLVDSDPVHSLNYRGGLAELGMFEEGILQQKPLRPVAGVPTG